MQVGVAILFRGIIEIIVVMVAITNMAITAMLVIIMVIRVIVLVMVIEIVRWVSRLGSRSLEFEVCRLSVFRSLGLQFKV